jgi:hypothetical protein
MNHAEAPAAPPPEGREKQAVTLPMAANDACCGAPAAAAAPERPPRLDQPFVEGSVATPAGEVPQVSSRLVRRDRWGAFKARWGVGRMDYTVDPGLYALGTPDPEAPVLVSANYKLSFDTLRAALPNRSAWLLVLDTRGINVWCAAGKGTFGTEELVKRIEVCGLNRIVSHRRLILPQLGAPGVAAHTVKKLSGFSVHYGPIAAGDLPAYLAAGGKATPGMRLKGFSLRERAVLIPVELVEALKPAAIIAPLLFLLGGIGGPSGFWANALNDGVFAVLAFLSAIVAGAVLHPLLLPYLPGRAFSMKGLWLGILVALVVLFLKAPGGGVWPGWIGDLAWLLIIPAVTAYLAMNFTGCSTYTSPSGVKREMRWALPLEIGLGLAGVVTWITARLIV